MKNHQKSSKNHSRQPFGSDLDPKSLQDRFWSDFEPHLGGQNRSEFGPKSVFKRFEKRFQNEHVFKTDFGAIFG